MKTKVRQQSIKQHKKIPRRQKTGRQIRIALVLAGIFFLMLMFFFGIRAARLTADGKIVQGVTVDGVDVGGMTKKEASYAIREHIEQLSQKSVSLSAESGEGAQTVLPLSSFGLCAKGLKASDLAEQACQVGRKGFPVGRYFSIRRAKKKGLDIPVTYDIDRKKSEQVLLQEEGLLTRTPVDASLTHENGEIKILDGQDGYTIKMKETLSLISEAVGTGWDKSDPSVTIAVKKTKPRVTADMLKDTKDELGSFSTYYGGGDVRSQNVETGTAHINGTILLPGEEFSADDAMAPYTEENGYGAAGSYENGKVVDTMGGGICQVSSTLYNAVLYAELEVTERYEHSMLVGYVSPGADAAIADDTKDLRFKNSTDAPIYIEGTTDGETVTMAIYGKETRDPNRELAYVSEITEETEHGTHYTYSGDYAFGTMNHTQGGRNGAEAVLWKVVLMNGEEVERTQVNSSYYAPADTIITVGISTENQEAANALITAVYSQDPDTIAAAINAAGSGGSDETEETEE